MAAKALSRNNAPQQEIVCALVEALKLAIGCDELEITPFVYDEALDAFVEMNYEGMEKSSAS